MDAEIIVVGSGASAVHAAQTLVEAGRDVLMVDAGIAHEGPPPTTTADSFVQLRCADPEQHEYFLGPNFESLLWGPTKAGGQVTPARRYMLARTDELTPLVSDSFAPFESLARGGLGVGWGAGSFCFTPSELAATGLDPAVMAESYTTVTRRIGVSRPDSLLMPDCAYAMTDFEDPVQVSTRVRALLERFGRRRAHWIGRGFKAGRPPLALLSRDRERRRAHGYRDMEFYDDAERSVYRPWMTLENLCAGPRFTYRPGLLVERFEAGSDRVTIQAAKLDGGDAVSLSCTRLVLCAGVLGSARVVLRSLPGVRELPLLCNPYSYVPTLAWRGLGRGAEERQLSLSQMAVLYDPRGDGAAVSMASAYTYRALMLFRLINESPLDFAYSRRLFQFLQSSLVIFGVHHPDRFGARRSVRLGEDGRRLEVEFAYSDDQLNDCAERDRALRGFMRGLGALPLRTLRPSAGASIHYGGTLAASDREAPGRCASDGRLWTAPGVFVADGSLLGYLPAKGVTLTLMAIGDQVARRVVASLR